MRKKHGEEGMEEEENIDSVLKWMWLFTIRPFLLISRLIELTGHSLLIVSIALDTKGAEEKGQQARSESRVISRNDRVSVFIVYGVGSRLSTGEKSPPRNYSEEQHTVSGLTYSGFLASLSNRLPQNGMRSQTTPGLLLRADQKSWGYSQGSMHPQVALMKSLWARLNPGHNLVKH